MTDQTNDINEQSETVQDAATGRWRNVYGKKTPKSGQPLPAEYAFESEDYGSAESASAAARLRSRYVRAGTPPGSPSPWLSSEDSDFINRYTAASAAQHAADIEARLARLNERDDLATLRQGPPSPPRTEAKPSRGVLGDIGRGVVEAVPQLAGGVQDAALNTLRMIHDAANWLRDHTPLKGAPLITFGAEASKTVTTPGGVSSAAGTPSTHPVRPGLVNLPAVPRVPEADSVTGGLVRGAGAFLVALAGIGKVTAPLPAARTALGGFAGRNAKWVMADQLAFDPDDPTLINAIEQHLAPELKIPLRDYLARNEGDTLAEARLKHAATSVLGNVAAEVFIVAARGIKTGIWAKKNNVPLQPAGARPAAETPK